MHCITKWTGIQQYEACDMLICLEKLGTDNGGLDDRYTRFYSV